MSEYRECECCGQALPPDTPEQVYFTPIKERIFNIVKRAGKHGIPRDVLIGRAWEQDPNGGPLERSTLRVHIWQMNLTLRPLGWEIRGTPGGNSASGRYSLAKVAA